jgi:hypothetical protein
MNESILVLGFGKDTYSVSDSIQSGLDQINSSISIQSFTSKWELRNWLYENASILPDSQTFRHDSRIFFNPEIFSNKTDYENTFFWNKYHSSHIKLLVISSCTRELESGLADIVYNNLDFSKKILPGVPKIIIDFSDGKWCETQSSSYLDLIQEFNDSIYHVKRNIRTNEMKNESNHKITQLTKTLVKSKYNLILENYLRLF